MRRQVFQFISVVFVACLLLLSGCGDSADTKSKKLLVQAEGLLQQGEQLQAERLLTDLFSRYPDTPSGITASKHLERMQIQRDLRQRERFVKVIDSYQKVFSGYHALYAEYPRSLVALDQSEYFFDSNYLQEITPDGYQVYLWLNDDGSGYSLWCVSKESARGYAVETNNRKLMSFGRDAMQQELQARFQASSWDGKLVVLQMRS